MFNENKFRDGDKVKALKMLHHGDWKTVSVFPDRYIPVPASTEVTVIRTWINCYGKWVRVEGPNGNHYDVREEDLQLI